MKRMVGISNLTRMQAGRVCMADYDKYLEYFCPVLPPPGILEHTLYSKGNPIVFLFAVVE